MSNKIAPYSPNPPPAIFNSTDPVFQDGEGGSLQIDSTGATKVTLDTTYRYISTATTTVVKSGAGFLHSIILSGGVNTGTITIYDNTSASGTIIGVIDNDGDNETVIYDCKFTTGLTVVTSTAKKLTVVYK